MIQTVQNSLMEIRSKYAILAYALMVLGMCIFVVPNVKRRSIQDSILYGGSFGLVVYGIYDFTAAAVLHNWNESLAIIDVLWGIFVYSAAAYAGSFFRIE